MDETETVGDVLVSSTVPLDASRAASLFEPEFTVAALVALPRKISGEEIVAGFFVGVAANAAFFGTQALVERLMRAIRAQRNEVAAKSGRLTVAVGGTTVVLRSDEELFQLEAVIRDWAAERDGR